MHAGAALGERGLFLGHAMAQALGGRYGVPHGAMNALCLPPALRFNEPVVPEALRLLGERARDGRCRRARRGARARWAASSDCATSASRRTSSPTLAGAAPSGPGARANPRPVTPADVEAAAPLDLVEPIRRVSRRVGRPM